MRFFRYHTAFQHAARAAAVSICAAAMSAAGVQIPQIPMAEAFAAAASEKTGTAATAIKTLRDSGASFNTILWAGQIAVVKKDEISNICSAMQRDATIAAFTTDASTRTASWKRFTEGERKLFAMLDLEIRRIKLSPEEKLSVKKTYWRLAAAEIAKNEQNFKSEETKKFFAAQKAIYEKKATVTLAGRKNAGRNAK